MGILNVNGTIACTECGRRAQAVRDSLKAENDKLRVLLADALIIMGFNEQQYLDKYLREEEGTTLIRELKNVGIEVG